MFKIPFACVHVFIWLAWSALWMACTTALIVFLLPWSKKSNFGKSSSKTLTTSESVKKEAVSIHASREWGCDELAEGYASMTEHWPQHEHIYRYTMFQRLGELSGMLVLDIPCGEGRFAEHIIRRGGRVVAVDIAAKMCEMTEGRIKAAGLPNSSLRTLVADVTKPLQGLEQCDKVGIVFLCSWYHYEDRACFSHFLSRWPSNAIFLFFSLESRCVRPSSSSTVQLGLISFRPQSTFLKAQSPVHHCVSSTSQEPKPKRTSLW